MLIENIQVAGIEAAVRGMRNPMNSWNKSDSVFESDIGVSVGNTIGNADHALMSKLAMEGAPNRKYLRMIVVYMDITAMQPWWSEFDTYKVGTVRNSCSKMHRIHVKPFSMDDFTMIGINRVSYAKEAMLHILGACEKLRRDFQDTKDQRYWRALIELLPEGYNLKATVMLNYETLSNIYKWRRNHKLMEWHTFCDMIESLPLHDLIITAADIRD